MAQSSFTKGYLDLRSKSPVLKDKQIKKSTAPEVTEKPRPSMTALQSYLERQRERQTERIGGGGFTASTAAPARPQGNTAFTAQGESGQPDW